MNDLVVDGKMINFSESKVVIEELSILTIENKNNVAVDIEVEEDVDELSILIIEKKNKAEADIDELDEVESEVSSIVDFLV